MKYTLFLFLFLFFAKINAMEICTKKDRNCPVYIELEPISGEIGSEFKIYSYGNVIGSIPIYGLENWYFLKGNKRFYLVKHLESFDGNENFYLLKLDNMCEKCIPVVVSERYVNSIRDMDFTGSYNKNKNYLTLSGLEKKLEYQYPLNGEINIGKEIASINYHSYKINRFNNNENIFYIEKYSKDGGYIGNKILYSPPLIKNKVNYLFLGCVDGCDFNDKSFGHENNTYIFWGDINTKIPIKMELMKVNNKIFGKYCYLKNCKEYLSLSGYIEKNGDFLLDEYFKNKKTGSVRLSLEGDNLLSGYWVSASGKKMSMLLIRAED